MQNKTNPKREMMTVITKVIQQWTDELYNEIKKEHIRVECPKCKELMPIGFNKKDIKKTFKGSMEIIEELVNLSFGYDEDIEYKFVEIVLWNRNYLDLLKYYTKGVIPEFAKLLVCSKCKE